MKDDDDRSDNGLADLANPSKIRPSLTAPSSTNVISQHISASRTNSQQEPVSILTKIQATPATNNNFSAPPNVGVKMDENEDGNDDDETGESYEEGDEEEEEDDEEMEEGEDDETRSVLSRISVKSNDSEKLELLMKLDTLRENGHVVRDFDLRSKTVEIKKTLYRLERSIEMKASIKFQQKMLMFIVSALEFGSKKFKPLFDFSLEGWSENVFENIEDYNRVFERLFDKYRRRGEMSPEVELLLTLAGSAFMFNMSKQLFKAIPQSMQVPMQQLRQSVRAAFDESQRQQQQQQQSRTMNGAGNNNGTEPLPFETSGHGSPFDAFSPMIGTLRNLVVPPRVMPEMTSHLNVRHEPTPQTVRNNTPNSIQQSQLQAFQEAATNDTGPEADDDRFSIASSSESIIESPVMDSKTQVKSQANKKRKANNTPSPASAARGGRGGMQVRGGGISGRGLGRGQVPKGGELVL